MDKETVIKLRNALKGDKNYPLIVYLDNGFRYIDESNTLRFTKWDDENGILYHFSLTDPNWSHGRSNINETISVYGANYEQIQGMEIAGLPQSELPNCIDYLNAEGAGISDEWKQRIISMFTKALNTSMASFGPGKINEAMGVRDGQIAVGDKDDYYAGRFTEPFLETRAMAKRNAYAEEQAKKQQEEATNKKTKS